jgi:hypothetical protein
MGRIYIRAELPNDPRVLRVARALGLPPLHVVGCLSALWIYADQHSHDGILSHVTPDAVDDMVGVARFAEMLVVVGWLIVGENEVTIPRFNEHCGVDQKRRKTERLRKRRQRRLSHGTDTGQTRDTPGTGAGRPTEVALSSASAPASSSSSAPASASASASASAEEKKPTTGADAPWVLPEWVPAPHWRAFCEMRQRIRAPLTQRAKELAVRDLDEIRQKGDDPGAVLDQSIKNSWRGLFPLKGGSRGPNGPTAPAADAGEGKWDRERKEIADARARRVAAG